MFASIKISNAYPPHTHTHTPMGTSWKCNIWKLCYSQNWIVKTVGQKNQKGNKSDRQKTKNEIVLKMKDTKTHILAYYFPFYLNFLRSLSISFLFFPILVALVLSGAYSNICCNKSVSCEPNAESKKWKTTRCTFRFLFLLLLFNVRFFLFLFLHSAATIRFLLANEDNKFIMSIFKDENIKHATFCMHI